MKKSLGTVGKSRSSDSKIIRCLPCVTAQRGYTLTELMVGLLIGLLVGSAMASVMLLTLRSSESALSDTLFQQDIRAVLALMGQRLSRAGMGPQVLEEGRCLVFQDAIDGRTHGFAFRQQRLFVRVGEGPLSSNCTGPEWQALTDPSIVYLEALTFTLEPVRCVQWQSGQAQTWTPTQTDAQNACLAPPRQADGFPVLAFVQVRMEGLAKTLPKSGHDALEPLRLPISLLRSLRYPMVVS
jgi:prepilin-type N-terminal cleavage/methylation domain-containing protein